MQPHVMLIVGNEQKFLAGIKQFESYVRHELKLGKRVTRMLAAYRKSQEILDEIWDAGAEKNRERRYERRITIHTIFNFYFLIFKEGSRFPEPNLIH